MSRTVGIAIAAITLVLVVAVGAAGQAPWQQFVHPQFGFSLSYPSGWEIQSGRETIAFMAIGPTPAGVAALRVNVNVVLEPIPASVTLDEFEAVSESRMELLFSGYRRLRTDRATAGTTPAILRYFTWRRNDGVELYQMQLYVLANGHAYVVTGTTSTQSSQLAREAELLLQILQTFRAR